MLSFGLFIATGCSKSNGQDVDKFIEEYGKCVDEIFLKGEEAVKLTKLANEKFENNARTNPEMISKDKVNDELKKVRNRMKELNELQKKMSTLWNEKVKELASSDQQKRYKEINEKILKDTIIKKMKSKAGIM
jgi:hypothetical protein